MPKPGSPIFKCVRRHEVCMWFLETLIRAPVVYFLIIKDLHWTMLSSTHENMVSLTLFFGVHNFFKQISSCSWDITS